MEILVYLEQEELRQMIAFALESQVSAEVVEAGKLADALSLLMEDRPLGLVILEDNAQTLKLLKYFSSIQSKIPIIYVGGAGAELGSAFPDLMVQSVVRPPQVVEKVLECVKKFVIENANKVDGEADGFVRSRIEVVTRVLPLLTDIYIRLSDVKFVKLFSQGTKFDDQEVVRSLRKKGVKYLYLRKDEIGEFLGKIKDEIDRLTHMTEHVTQEQAFDVVESTHELVMEMSDKLGFTKEIQELAKKNVDLTLQKLGKHPKLSKILELVERDPKQYISSHSVVVAHLACSLARLMDWPSETTFAKLTYAAYFHDFSLRNDGLAKLRTLKELDGSGLKFSEKDRTDYKNHPLAGAQIIQHFAEIPPDVDSMILQHHERPDGKGFPRGLTAAQIAPLSSLFIVAHDMFEYFARTGKDGTLQGFIKEVEAIYTARHFKQIFSKLVSEVEAGRAEFGKVGS